MTYFSINGQDFSHIVSGLKVGFETLVSDKSGRNANGDMTIDIINRKKKLYVSFRHMTKAEMESFLSAISPYVVQVGYLNPQTGGLSVFSGYTGTPEPEYYTIQGENTIYKPMTLNFIER